MTFLAKSLLTAKAHKIEIRNATCTQRSSISNFNFGRAVSFAIQLFLYFNCDKISHIESVNAINNEFNCNNISR